MKPAHDVLAGSHSQRDWHVSPMRLLYWRQAQQAAKNDGAAADDTSAMERQLLLERVEELESKNARLTALQKQEVCACLCVSVYR